MSNRQIPQELYDTVFELVTIIAQPENLQGEPDDAAAKIALGKLRTLFANCQAAGSPDPFLTETMADFTNEDAEAVQLYHLAIQQCAAFPGEPIHTKRQSLAERLIELGRTDEAASELNQAVREAFAAGDSDAVKDLNDLLQQLADKQT